MIVFLDDDVTEEERQSIEKTLGGHDQVRSYDYWDEAASYAEAREMFEDDAAMTAKLEAVPDIVPTSYRITLVEDDHASAAQVIVELDGRPGVLDVRFLATPP